MSKIILKKSSVTGKVPVTADLDYGELALNYADGKIYFKKADNSIGFFDTNASSGSAGSNFTVSSSPPSSPNSGDEWLDSNSAIKYTYVDDGTSQQWVELESALSISQQSTGSSSIYNNEYIFSGVSTGSAETELFINGVSNNRMTVPLNKTIYYTADIVCRRTDSPTDNAAFYVKGVARNVAGVVTDVGLVYEVMVVRTDASFAVDFRADNATDTVNFYVRGNVGKTLSWQCAVTVLEV
jgi:hypothetical protein